MQPLPLLGYFPRLQNKCRRSILLSSVRACEQAESRLGVYLGGFLEVDMGEVPTLLTRSVLAFARTGSTPQRR